MRVLVTYGSKRGGTAEIARWISEELGYEGFAVDFAPAREVRDVSAFDAVIVGGALYMGAWHRNATRFVLRHKAALRERHVWLFSSGPLDASASTGDVPATPEVSGLLAHVGGHGHATFGGVLGRSARGLVASSIARDRAGDYRDLDQIEAWTRHIAKQLAEGPTRPSRPSSLFPPLPSRGVVSALCLLTGISAILGGGALSIRSDGSLVGMPLTVLQHSPFSTFLVPGLILLSVVGVGCTWSGVAHLQRRAFAPLYSLASGIALVVWMIVECLMLRSLNALQAVCLAIGVAIVERSVRALRAWLPAREIAASAPLASGRRAGARA